MRYAWEKLRDLLREPNVRELILEHWEEIGEDKEQIPLAFDVDHHLDLDDRGYLKILTARTDDGLLVGYCCHVVNRHPNYPVLYAWDSPYFLDPEYRKGGAGLRLFAESDKGLAEMGVKRVIRHEKVAHPVAPLFERLGYRLYERRWTRLL